MPTKKQVRIEGDRAFVPLSKGYEAIIDAADAPKIRQIAWFAMVRPHTVYAVHRSFDHKLGKARTIRMHREIVCPPDGAFVDHIDRNGLNNTRANLRVVTHRENCGNRGPFAEMPDHDTGVHWNKRDSNWRSEIRVDGKRLYLGSFKEKADAVSAYKAARDKAMKERK